MAEASFDWAQRFDEAARVLLAESPESVAGLEHHADYPAAAPTPDHFIPLLYLAGVAAAAGCPAEVLVDGYAYGSLSMASYAVDLPCPPAGAGADRSGRAGRDSGRRHQHVGTPGGVHDDAPPGR